MKQLKIFITVLLVLSLFPIVPVFASEVEETIPIELTETEEFKKLSAFGVVSPEDEVFYLDNVSRAVFLSYVMKCYFGNTVTAESFLEKNPFADVTQYTFGREEILAAYTLGIISKSENFRPNDNITMQEASKILVCLIGSGEIAKSYGGYPSGFLRMATERKLFEKCRFTKEGYIPVYDFMKILLNLLETELFQMVGARKTDDGVSLIYTDVTDMTMLEHSFGIKRGRGVFESNEYTSVNGYTELGDNQVEIAGAIYECNDRELKELLGYNVEYYYKEEEFMLSGQLIYAEKKNVEEIVVRSENIDKEQTSAANFVYYEDRGTKLQKKQIPKAATLIYNGAQQPLNTQTLCPSKGTVALIDNNRDEKIDVIKVMNYRTIQISGISQNSYSVSDKLGGKSIVLDPEDDGYDVYIEKDGEESDYLSLTEGDIISYAASIGNKKNIKYVIVSSKTIEGVPEAKDEDSVTFNGIDYDIDLTVLSSLSLNESGVFYFDFLGQIVAKKVVREVVYGYLNNVGVSKDFEKSVMVHIFTENNRWVQLEVKDKITYNRERKRADEFYQDWKDEKITRGLITYTVTDEGIVNMISAASSFPEYSEEEKVATEKNIFRVYPEIASAPWRDTPSSFGNSVIISDRTKIFLVPDQSENLAKEEDFDMLAQADLIDYKEYKNIIPYDLDSARIAGAVVMSKELNSGFINTNSAFLVIDSIIKVSNSDGVFVDAIKGYYQGTLISIPALNDGLFNEEGKDNLDKGDVILIKLDNDGNIIKVQRIYDFSDSENKLFIRNTSGNDITIASAYSSMVYIAGEIYSADAQQNRFIANVPGGKMVLGIDKNTVIRIYDTEEKVIKDGAVSDLEKGRYFVSRIASYVADEIIVYY